MKSKCNPFVPFIALTASFALSPLYAATIDTTGSTSGAPVLLVAGNTYIGDGFLNALPPVAPATETGLGGSTVFTMTGGVFTIESGAKVVTYGGTNFNNNLHDMQVDGTLDLWDNGNQARVDALNGSSSGSIVFGYPWNNRQLLHLGLDNGSGTFSGTVAAIHWNGNGINIIKSGTGTQTFDNLANQPFRSILINQGVVNLSNAADVSFATPVTGAGTLSKSGLGVLTLTGSIANTGEFKVTEGTVSVGTNLTPNLNVVISTGALMDLNFAGTSTVNSITLGLLPPLPPGTYNSTTHGSYFTATGTGSLKILAPTGDQDGSWSSLADGNWSEPSNWTASTVANGAEKTATFGVASAVTVTVDSNRTIGSLVFNGANHILASNPGATVTFDNGGNAPSITVASGIEALITGQLASSSGLDKNGDGTLILASASSITGGTIINGGKLVLENTTAGGPSFNIGTGTTLELAYLSGGGRNMSNGTINGRGNLVKTGTSLASFGNQNQTQTIALEASSVVDIQEGVFRNEWGAANWSGNLADLNVKAGAFFDLWDANVSVDAITGAGVINKGWLGAYTFTFGVADSVPNADYPVATFSGTISNTNQSYGGNGGGTLNLVKTGVGTQAFTGSTPFRGALTVSQGTLSLGDGTNHTALSDTTPVTVATGAKLDLKFTGSDAVASVKLGDTTYDTPGDTFGFANYPDFFTGSGTLRIAGDFETWASNSGLTGGADDDDDNDGVSNKEEYAFGLLPKNGSSVNPIVVQLDKTTATFSYTRRKTSLGTNLTYSVWFSTDLAGWTKDTGATEGALVQSGDNETVPITLSALAGNPLPDKLFIQVRAE